MDLAVHICLKQKSQKNTQMIEQSVGEITGNISPIAQVNEKPAHWSNKFSLQSEDVPEEVDGDVAIGNQVEGSETVTFIDNEGGVYLELPTSTNPVAMVDNTNDLSLGNFLARPTLINTTNWSTSDIVGVKATFKPWYEFLNSPAIKKKVDNYAFMRGNLHLKVVVNGTPFQYGALRTCYSPLLGWIPDKIRTNLVSTGPLLIPYSQQPGFFVHPQANAGGEMVCRFFLHKNWMDITSATEVNNMGTINHVIYAPLQVAVTGGSTSVTIRTYAWMTDVELMGSTSKLTLQGDEYGQGPVSLPASAIAAAAGALTKLPIIGRFARATQIGAGAVSKMAALFGYTNVPVISDIMAYQPMNAPMLASTSIGTPLQKLTLDPKQELSVDPSFHGIGSVDELSMSYIRSRESYFGATSWSTSDAADTQLFNVRINPALGTAISVLNSTSATVGQRVYHVPLSYVGALFRHWRGDIKIRMKLIVTKFHKGRLKISYDPRNDITSVNPAENTVYTEIVDIGEKDDITFTIPYHQDVGWLACDDTFSDNWSGGNVRAPRIGVDNGVLTVRVLNTLTAPSSGSVNILFFVEGGDNFEFANPKGMNRLSGTIPTPFALQGEDVTSVVTHNVVIGAPSKPIVERYGQNFGEAFLSLRVLLHRMTLTQVLPAIDGAPGVYNTRFAYLKRMPAWPGYDPSAYLNATNIVSASGTSKFSAAYPNLLPYIAGMYLGHRGSVNYALTPSAEYINSLDDVRVLRTDINISNAANRQMLNSDFAAPQSATFRERIGMLSPYNTQLANKHDGLGGMAITATRTNGSVTFNFPDYNNYNFALVDPTTFLLGSTNDGTAIQSALVTLKIGNTSADTVDYFKPLSVQVAAGAGPDFTLLHFLCCPTLDYISQTPVFS